MIEQIERIVNQGIDSLRISLDVYWPAKDPNDMAERNLTVHVAHSFLKSGWCVYHEASFPNDANRRLDMLSFNPETKTFVAVESKILQDGTRAMSIAGDAERVKIFKPEAYLNSKMGFGLLLAATWSEEMKDWWKQEEDHRSPPQGSAGEGWEPLGKYLDRYKAICRARWLQDDDEAKDEYQTQWALYAIFKIHG